MTTPGAVEKIPGKFFDYGGAVFNVQHLDFGATGNGTTNDYDAIVLAIAAASDAGGGIVYFPPGTYLIDEGLSIDDKVALVGAGNGVTIIDGLTVTGLATDTGIIDYTGVTGVRVEGLHMKAEDNYILTASGCSEILIKDNYFSQPSGSTNASKCVLVRWPTAGGSLGSTDFVNILSNRFTPEANAILCIGHATGPWSIEEVNIIGNHISNANRGTGGTASIKVDVHCSDVVIAQNIIRMDGGSNFPTGIEVSEDTDGVLVTDNDIEGAEDECISLTAGQTNGDLDDIFIVSNFLHDMTAGGDGQGVTLNPGSGAFNNIVIQSNLFTNVPTPIREDADGTTQLVVADNIMLDSSSTVMSLQSDDSQILRNVIQGSAAVKSIGIAGAPTGIRVVDNVLGQTDGSGDVVTTTGSGHVFARNTGYITEANGSATLANGSTTIVVTHGLDVTPTAGDIMVTPIEDWGAMTSFWVDTLTATQFTINADQDPTADVDFAWKAEIL